MQIIDQRVVVTGAGGMLGRALTEGLTGRGMRPISLSRADCDISKPADRKSIFDHHPTVLLNCAAHTKVDLCEQETELANQINGYAVGELAAMCRENGTFLVHVSTDFVFDGRGNRPYKPDDPVNPLSAYGRSKLLGETELRRQGGGDWMIVRTAWVYGRGGANFPRTMVQAAQAGKPLTVVSDQMGSPTYTVDLGAAILDLLDAGGGGVFHATNSGQTTWYDFAKAALEDFGVRAEIAPISSAEWAEKRPTAAIRPGYSVLDLEPLERRIGHPMRPWRAALKDYRAAVQRDGF